MPYTFEARPKTKLSAALGLATATATAALIALPSPALAADSGGLGTASPSAPPTATTAGSQAKLVDGYAVAPRNAPKAVIEAIEAGNRIIDKPYCLGGGHARWESRCYDCSGTVSYALGDKGAGILKSPMPSGSFMNWEKRGPGEWITVYANGGHMYVVIAGLRLDTSQTPGDGPGWSKGQLRQSGFTVRHPAGF